MSTVSPLVASWITGQRRDRQQTFENGALALSEFGSEILARTQRTAAWIQDDWSFSPTWAAYAGLRWEGIDTRSDYSADSSLSPVRNQSVVWTPLLHSVWKLDEKGRDQVRFSLTRSYRSPTLQNLVARPSLSRAANDATTPDRAGNAGLKPELATGIDLAFEHYLDGGGLLSVNLFHRQIRDLIRNTTLLETVSWSNDPRWVSRPRNVGPASSSGIELEGKLRLNEWLARGARGESACQPQSVRVPGERRAGPRQPPGQPTARGGQCRRRLPAANAAAADRRQPELDPRHTHPDERDAAQHVQRESGRWTRSLPGPWTPRRPCA